MSDDSGREKTWIIVKDGKSVKDHKIEVRILAKILTDVQRAYDNIGQSKYGNDYKKEDFQLYLGEILTGSVALPVAPLTFAPRLIDEPNPFRKVTTCFELLIDSLKTNPEKFKPQLEEEITDPSNRIGVLKSMHSLSQSDSPIHLKNSIEKPADDGHSIRRDDAVLINKLLADYTTPGELTIHGLMLGFQVNKKPYYFTIKTENERNVRCYFDKKDAEHYHSFFWKWVTVTGNAVTTQKSYKLSSVSEISEQSTESIDKIGDYKLKKPIVFQTSYEPEDNIWGLVNEELALYGYGTNYLKTIKSLEEKIEGHVISFIRHPETEHTKESVEIKDKLKTYVDFKAVSKNIKEKYGEN